MEKSSLTAMRPLLMPRDLTAVLQEVKQVLLNILNNMIWSGVLPNRAMVMLIHY